MYNTKQWNQYDLIGESDTLILDIMLGWLVLSDEEYLCS